MTRRIRRGALAGALLAAALLCLALAPVGWFAARDAALNGRVLAAVQDGELLGEAGRQNALARRLYLDRGKTPSVYDSRTATDEEARLFAGCYARLAGRLPWLPELPRDPAGEALQTSELEGGRRMCLLSPADEDGSSLALLFSSGSQLLGMQLSCPELPDLDLAQAADTLLALNGLDTLGDWTEREGRGRGAALARYSPGGQIYLHANQDAGFVTLGVVSMPPGALDAL